MRMTEINIDDKHITNGLKPIIMNQLNQCVLIVGKNGSGKSRLLSQLRDTFSQKPNKRTIQDTSHQIKLYEKNIKQIENLIGMLEKQPSNNSVFRQNNTDQISQKRRQFEDFSKTLDNFKNIINWSIIKTDGDYDNYTTISFVPKKIEIKDSSDTGRKSLDNLAKSALNIGLDHISESTYAYIQVLQDKKFNATHPEIKVSEEEKKKAIEEYSHMNEIVKIFLGCEIDRDLNGQATIFGFQLAKSNLSSGQKALLQYCVAIHAQEASLDDHILILDEPENHLHPSILIELIEKIKIHNKKGQIWIATHSIPLISHFDTQDIWYMEDGLISRDGKVTEKALKGLLGDEERIEKLKDFLDLPAFQTFCRYAYEALFPPKAINTDHKDPQTIQIHSAIKKYIQPNEKIKILDYGAGKGRILNCCEEDKKIFNEQVDYYAFDKSYENKEECICSIKRLYDNPNERYFQNEKDLRSKHDEYSFDIVIMCNVLHEIDPNDWLEIFGSNGFITKTLKNPGILLLVEDHQLSHGEKAYQNGFIVLDTPELKKLFCISSTDANFSYDDFQGNGRLKAHRIPQLYLQKVTNETRLEALEELVENAKREISDIRKSEQKDYKSGRLIGFWTLQLCNAILALSKLR
jgi:ABC-type cobalamin/Fe3+-siderophores transport system ATPase subunit